MSYLNTESEFFIPALAPAFFNVFSIAVPIALYGYFRGHGKDPILGMAIGVTIGGFAQLAVQIPRLRKRGFVYSLHLRFRDPALRKSMALFFPVAIGLSGSRFNIFVNTLLISFLQQGSISWLNYAYRIFFLPLGMFGVAVGQVSLPSFSRFVNENRIDDLRRNLADSLRMVLFLTIPTSALIAALAYPITSVIYEHGRFTTADTKATAAILVLYIIGVPFVSALRNIASVYYAYHDARRPMYASFASVGVNVLLNLALMRILGYRAFPLAATIASVVNIGILYAFLPQKNRRLSLPAALSLCRPACPRLSRRSRRGLGCGRRRRPLARGFVPPQVGVGHCRRLSRFRDFLRGLSFVPHARSPRLRPPVPEVPLPLSAKERQNSPLLSQAAGGGIHPGDSRLSPDRSPGRKFMDPGFLQR